MVCKWCGIQLYWKKIAGGGSTPYEDEALTKVHICPKRPRENQPAQQEQTPKQVKIPPLTDREIQVLRKLVYFIEELEVK